MPSVPSHGSRRLPEKATNSPGDDRRDMRVVARSRDVHRVCKMSKEVKDRKASDEVL